MTVSLPDWALETLIPPGPVFGEHATANATITRIRTADDITDRNHLLPLEELYADLKDCRAATKLLIVDACRNDPTQPGVFRAGLASATLPRVPPPPASNSSASPPAAS